MLFSIPDWTNRGQNIRPSKPRSPMPNMSATVQPCPAEQRLREKPSGGSIALPGWLPSEDYPIHQSAD
jgi:hypothetical protein